MWDWITTPLRSGKEHVRFVVLAVLVSLLWASFISTAYEFFFPFSASMDGAREFFRRDPASLIMMLAISLIAEEVIRLLPLALLLSLRSMRERPAIVMGMAVLVSAIFGALHVSNGLPLAFALLCQGVIGFFYTVAYLKAGGLQGGMMGPLMGIMVSYCIHLAYDLALFLPGMFFS